MFISSATSSYILLWQHIIGLLSEEEACTFEEVCSQHPIDIATFILRLQDTNEDMDCSTFRHCVHQMLGIALNQSDEDVMTLYFQNKFILDPDHDEFVLWIEKVDKNRSQQRNKYIVRLLTWICATFPSVIIDHEYLFQTIAKHLAKLPPNPRVARCITKFVEIFADDAFSADEEPINTLTHYSVKYQNLSVLQQAQTLRTQYFGTIVDFRELLDCDTIREEMYGTRSLTAFRDEISRMKRLWEQQVHDSIPRLPTDVVKMAIDYV